MSRNKEILVILWCQHIRKELVIDILLGTAQFKLWSCPADWALPASPVPWLCDYSIACGVIFWVFSWLPASCPSPGLRFCVFPVTAGRADAQQWREKLTVNFIQTNKVAVAGRDWEETAKNWFLLHVELKMALITSVCWVWPCHIQVWIKFTGLDTNVKYLVWEKLLLLFLAQHVAVIPWHRICHQQMCTGSCSGIIFLRGDGELKAWSCNSVMSALSCDLLQVRHQSTK